MRTSALLAFVLVVAAAGPALAAPAPANEQRTDLEARINFGPLLSAAGKGLLGGAGIAGLTALLSGGNKDDGSGKRSMLNSETIALLNQLGLPAEGDVQVRGLGSLFAKGGEDVASIIKNGIAGGVGSGVGGALIHGLFGDDNSKRALADMGPDAFMRILKQAAQVDKRDPIVFKPGDFFGKPLYQPAPFNPNDPDAFRDFLSHFHGAIAKREHDALSNLLKLIGKRSPIILTDLLNTPFENPDDIPLNDQEGFLKHFHGAIAKRAEDPDSSALNGLLKGIQQMDKHEPFFLFDLLKQFLPEACKRAPVILRPNLLDNPIPQTDPFNPDEPQSLSDFLKHYQGPIARRDSGSAVNAGVLADLLTSVKREPSPEPNIFKSILSGLFGGLIPGLSRRDFFHELFPYGLHTPIGPIGPVIPHFNFTQLPPSGSEAGAERGISLNELD